MENTDNLDYIKSKAKKHFDVSDTDFPEWYLHFLPIYWDFIDKEKAPIKRPTV